MSKPIAITMGDPAGIGPEIIAKAFRDAPEVTAGCLVVGDVANMRRGARLAAGFGRIQLPVAPMATPGDLADVPPACIPVLQPGPAVEAVALGRVSAQAGRIAAECVLWAADAALRGDVAAVVTAPLHKEALAAAGEPYGGYPGHTEMLQARAARSLGKSIGDVPVRMMLANHALRTVLVSIHMSLRAAIDAVTIPRVLETLHVTHKALEAVVGRAPRIAVAGLNPHAGEGGLFGREEIEVIAPALQLARAQGLDVHGPFAPDTIFMRARERPGQLREFDVVVAMYHDQGLIPVKYLGVEDGVNATLGLPFVRTSPDHGTAFDIAGTGRADASSLIEAIRMARLLTQAAMLTAAGLQTT
jgi:4-hydroxythreonine-4-phosphate dehydrogenase